jgi:hypothetical protein
MIATSTALGISKLPGWNVAPVAEIPAPSGREDVGYCAKRYSAIDVAADCHPTSCESSTRRSQISEAADCRRCIKGSPT